MRRLYQAGIVESDDLAFNELRDDASDLTAVIVRGRVSCGNAITVEVDKLLETRRRADGRWEVRGAFYTYQAWQQLAAGARQLLRYDSSTAEPLHVHRYDSSGQEIEKRPIPFEELPNLDQFIEAAYELGRTAGDAS